jgi:hypothetical protein
MIWTLKIECIDGRYLEQDWIRVVEMDSGSSLGDVHDLIQDSIGFDRDHLFEFFAGRNPRNRLLTFGDMDELEDTGRWGEITLEEIFPLDTGLKLYYHFDFGDDWYFKIAKQRTKAKPPAAGVAYPQVIQQTGPNPSQYG